MIDVVQFSESERLLRATAYVSRFVNNLKLKKRGSDLVVGELGVAEICEAEKLWIRWEQSIITKENKKF